MMFKRIKFLFLFLIFLFLFSFDFSLAYEPIPTHRDLTAKIIEVYNKKYEPKITKEQTDWIINGAIKEDTAPRWVNHFYDPIYKVGWNGDNQSDISGDTIKKLSKIFLSVNDSVSSLNWLHNQDLQKKYGLYDGNQTYDWALRNYAYAENKRSGLFSEMPNNESFEKAFNALGHSLHLLEDLGVPAHTRNDSHADGDPYEKWATEPGNANLNALDNLKNSDLNFNCQKIDDCFVKLATYTNENFYSKDTIGDKKYRIIRASEIIEIGSNDIFFGEDNFGNEYPFKIYNRDSRETTISDNQIHQAYWNLLSKQIVLAGAEAVKVFYEDARKETERVQFQPHAIAFKGCDISFICADTFISPMGEFSKLAHVASSFIGSAINTTKNTLTSAGSFVKNIFSSNSSLKQVDQVVVDNQQNRNSDTVDIKVGVKEDQNLNTKTFKKEIIVLKNDAVKNSLVEKKSSEEQKKIIDQIENEIIKISTSTTKISDLAKKAEINQCSFNSNQNPSHEGVIINEIAWMGGVNSANDEWIELKNISNSSINLSGWQLLSKDGGIKINLSELKTVSLQPGKFILLERTDDSSAPGSANLIYSGALSNSNEELRLFDSKCNLADRVVANSNWPAGDNSLKKTMERNTDGSQSSLTNQFGWHTSVSAGGTPKKENSQQFIVYSGGGGGGGVSSVASTQQPITSPQQQIPKILISEIKISPTNERFIELYNPNGSEVNLTDWYIQRKTGSEFSSFISKTNFAGKVIPANGYFLISRSDLTGSDIVISNLTLTSSNTIQLKNSNQEVADKVGWGSISDFEGAGAALNPADNQSIQRKFQNSSFVDTDNNSQDFEIQNCASPKAQTASCQVSENFEDENATTTVAVMNAQFNFSPVEPEENELITFNAASSTASFGSISLYEWQFSDNSVATSTEPTTIHYFSSSGIYTAQLTVYGDGNASSTTSLAINVSPIIPELQGADHIVISEILFDAAGSDSGKEFIELYNPTEADIDMSDWSMRILINNSTSTDLLVKFGSKGEDNSLVKTKSFLLIGFNNYNSTTTPADILRSVALPNSSSTIYLLDGEDNEIDIFSYGGEIILEEGQSVERKAFQNNECVLAQDSAEFFGNGCDADNTMNDFEIRLMPNPQNSLSLPEPRNAPSMTQDFSVFYNEGDLSLNFSWSASVGYNGTSTGLNYKIVDFSSNSSIIDINTTSTVTSIVINEIGRIGENNYKFFIQAFDSDGLGSASSTASIEVPSFIENLAIYRKPDGFLLDQNIFGDSYSDMRKYLINFNYNEYPFTPGGGYKVMVFYLNSESTSTVINSDGRGMHFVENNNPDILKIGYRACSMSPDFYNSLVLAETPDNCGLGGLASDSLMYKPEGEQVSYNLIEDKNILLPAFNDDELNQADYFTISFYTPQSENQANLIAVDKIKYYFSDNIANYQAPYFPDQSTLGLDFNKQDSKLIISWPGASDDDTLDRLIRYEIQFEDGGEWETLSGAATSTGKIVSPGDDLSIRLRAKDEFNNFNEEQILSAPWTYPETVFYITQANENTWTYDFGYYYGNCKASCGDMKSIQSITPEQDFQFNKVVLRLWQSTYNDSANLRLRVYGNNNGLPDGNILGESVVNNLGNPDQNSDIVFSFDSPIPVTSGNRYWLILDVSDYSNGTQGFYRNYWKNAISTSGSYIDGEAGRCFNNGCFDGNNTAQSVFEVPMPSNADWYMKIGLE